MIAIDCKSQITKQNHFHAKKIIKDKQLKILKERICVNKLKKNVLIFSLE